MLSVPTLSGSNKTTTETSKHVISLSVKIGRVECCCDFICYDTDENGFVMMNANGDVKCKLGTGPGTFFKFHYEYDTHDCILTFLILQFYS